MTQRFSYYILFVCCFLVCENSYSQVIENQFTHYTSRDGLPEGNINDIKQDKDGFLWLATLNGLSRFDGHTFKTFRHIIRDTTSLYENHINGICIDSKDRLWCVSFNCLYLYHPDGEWFEHFVNDGADLVHIYDAGNDQLTIAGALKGLYQFDVKEKKYSKIDCDRLDSNGCTSFLKDNDSISWLSTRNGLFRFNAKTRQHVAINQDRGHMVNLSDSSFLSGSFNHGIFIVNRKTNGRTEFHHDKGNNNSLPDEMINCIYKLNDSIVLIGTSGGITVFNWKRETFTNILPEKTNPTGLPGYIQHVANDYCIFQDREGIIWIGGKTLERYDFKNFKIDVIPTSSKGHFEDRFLDFANIYPLPQQGRFLLGSYHGMYIYDSVSDHVDTIREEQFVLAADKGFMHIRAFNTDKQKRIWCLAEQKLCSFELKEDHAINIHRYTIPFSTHTGGITLDSKDRILISTIDRGMIRFDPTDSTFTFFDTTARSPVRITNMKVRAICCARDGSVWLGTQKGINKMEKDDSRIKQYGEDKNCFNKITNWIINDIKEDTHGIIWFSTLAQGIGRIDPSNDSVSFLSYAQGLPTCLYGQLCLDDYDNLWARTQMGIVRINTATRQSQLYTENEGFPVPDGVISMNYSKATKRLYILTSYSIFEINPGNASYNIKVPVTLITGFSVFDKERPLHAANAIDLQYNENFINIEFAALLFHSNEQIKYAYKMDGVDKDWVYCNFNRNASYTNLAPGHYTFFVRAQGPDGAWSVNPTILNVTIRPPFWKTWWFYFLETISAIAIIFQVVRLYTARKLATQKIEIEKLMAVSAERSRIAAEMHDELGAGLTSIRMLSEIAGNKIKQEVTARPEIEKIEKSASNLSENLREIIWTMNTRFDHLDDFIIYIRTYAVEYFDDTKIDFRFISPGIIPDIKVSGELRRNIFLCIKEALHNILKHAHASEAVLVFDITGAILTVTIRDNGIGIKTNKAGKFGSGLNTMNERLKKCGSQLNIEGATIRFSVPIN